MTLEVPGTHRSTSTTAERAASVGQSPISSGGAAKPDQWEGFSWIPWIPLGYSAELSRARRCEVFPSESLVMSGDATLDTLWGAGFFERLKRLGVRHGFSYSDLNMAFGAAKLEAQRCRLAMDTFEFSASLSMVDGARVISIDANDSHEGKAVFVGSTLPGYISDAFLAHPKLIPSLQRAYPGDRSVSYPQLLDEDVDMVFTSEENIRLQMPTRDCMAAIIAVRVPGISISGLLHSGWRQADGGIGSRLVKILTSGSTIQPSDITVAIPPCLRQEHLVLEHLGEIRNLSAWRNFCRKEEDGYHLDFVGLFKRQLIEHGIPPENILDSEVDTYEAQSVGRGHSARYQRQYGLESTSMITVVES